MEFCLPFALSHPPSTKCFLVVQVCPFFSTHTSFPLIFVDFLYSYAPLRQSPFRISYTLEWMISFYLAKITWCFGLVHVANVLLNFDLVCQNIDRLFTLWSLWDDYGISVRVVLPFSYLTMYDKPYSFISGSRLNIIKTIILVVELLRLLLLLEDIAICLPTISIRGSCIHYRIRLIAVPHFICKNNNIKMKSIEKY